MNLSLFVVVSQDAFIADRNGRGDFSSEEDKKHLRAFLRSDHCDCFICGRKTAQEFEKRLTFKPLLILTRQKMENSQNRFYFNSVSELLSYIDKNSLKSPVLLGGAQAYQAFLDQNLVDRIVLTSERVLFHGGKKLDFQKYKDNFVLEDQYNLSDRTSVSVYVKK